MTVRPPSSFWVLEDTSAYHERGDDRHNGSAPIAMRLYRVRRGHPDLIDETVYLPRAEGRGREFKGNLAIDLLRRSKIKSGIVVAGSRVAGGTSLLKGLGEMGLDFVIALPASVADHQAPNGEDSQRSLARRLSTAVWTRTEIRAPGSDATYSIVDVGRVSYGGLRGLRCVALSTGGIADFGRGLVVGISSLPPEVSSEGVAQLLGWTRWLRFVSRRTMRKELAASQPYAAPVSPESANAATKLVTNLRPRVNLKISRKHDRQVALHGTPGLWDSADMLEGRLANGKQRLNVVELFAGAGGMGLGFLMARAGRHSYRVLYSGEIDAVFANTLRINHEFLFRQRLVDDGDVPEETYAADLRSSATMERVQAATRNYGGVDIVIGGPPCQGFSNANRNSWSSKNPNNKLVDTYLDYVVRLRPKVFIMENVQGILWTPKHDAFDQLSVAADVATRLAAAGYRIFPKLIDAAWYGVPQHRNRFFLLGIHSDLGYAQDDFGEWGPYPRPTHGIEMPQPYVTVREALEDLPPILNGASCDELPYAGAPVTANEFLTQMRQGAPASVIWDHVTSRHAEYVIDRYRKIPAGGNWSNISTMMTNYADVGRTHSNIYRRLTWDEPSITIGHYRKAMLVHPSQNRGLSLREASRLQSFPDWFRFAGSEQSVEGGLTYKQQQLGNAVSPLVAKALATYLLKL